MALAPDLQRLRWRDLRGRGEDTFVINVLAHKGKAVLPRKLALDLRDDGSEQAKFVRRLPAHLEDLADKEDEARLEKAKRGVGRLLGYTPFPYYALVELDGDKMGALRHRRGSPDDLEQGWHPQVREGVRPVAARNPHLREYLAEKRAMSPARHVAISEALNAFALNLAPAIVEELFKGQLIYAGGDDLLAMLVLDDLLPCMTLLRLAYSGVLPGGQADNIWQDHLAGVFGRDIQLRDGFVLYRNKRSG